MRSVARKAAVTAGLGAALVAGAAGTATAAGVGNAGLLHPQLPAAPLAAAQGGVLGQTFPVTTPLDQLPTGQVTSTLQQATGQALPQVQQAVPHAGLPGLPVG